MRQLMESKKNSKNSKNSKNNHSITFYIPHKDLISFTNAIKQAALQVFGDTDKRNNLSRYIRDIINKDLEERGLLVNGKEYKEKKKDT